MSAKRQGAAQASAQKASEREPHRLAKRNRCREVCIGMLTWSAPEIADCIELAEHALVDALGQVRNERRRLDADLILCSGAQFGPPVVRASAVTGASGGVPVLCERPANGRNAWWLAVGSRWRNVRRGQYVTGRDNAREGGAAVLDELSRGLGTIQVGSRTLVLLICGEARILQCEGFRGWDRHIPRVLGEAHIILRPTHRPYRSRSHQAGGNLVDNFMYAGIAHDPVLQTISREGPAFGGAVPDAIVHVGPWTAGNEWQRSVAMRVFRGGRAERVESWENGEIGYGVTRV